MKKILLLIILLSFGISSQSQIGTITESVYYNNIQKTYEKVSYTAIIYKFYRPYSFLYYDLYWDYFYNFPNIYSWRWGYDFPYYGYQYIDFYWYSPGFIYGSYENNIKYVRRERINNYSNPNSNTLNNNTNIQSVNKKTDVKEREEVKKYIPTYTVPPANRRIQYNNTQPNRNYTLTRDIYIPPASSSNRRSTETRTYESPNTSIRSETNRTSISRQSTYSPPQNRSSQNGGIRSGNTVIKRR